MAYTQIKIKQEYREKLAILAKFHNRSMANMVEVLIDQADTRVTDLLLKAQDTDTPATSEEQK